MINFAGGSKIMVIAAHPDDEVLGCGAAIHKLVDSGAEAHALILGTGLASRYEHKESIPGSAIDILRQNAKASAAIIGYKTLSFEDFPDNRMDSAALLDIIRTIDFYANKHKPDIIFTHHHSDLNIDHRITFNAVLTAFRPLISCSVNGIFCFETPSSTEWNFPYYRNTFSPNVFINVEDSMDIKINALKCYESEIRNAPHPRSPEIIGAIAKRWGSVAGFEYAEAFELVMSKVL